MALEGLNILGEGSTSSEKKKDHSGFLLSYLFIKYVFATLLFVIVGKSTCEVGPSVFMCVLQEKFF